MNSSSQPHGSIQELERKQLVETSPNVDYSTQPHDDVELSMDKTCNESSLIVIPPKVKRCASCSVQIVYWILIFIAWVGLCVEFGVLRASPVQPDNPRDYRRNIYIGSNYTVDKGYPALMVHVIGGISCLFIGILQFQDIIRKRAMIVHKVLGYIFSGSLFIGFIGGVWLIPYSAGGVNTKVGFSLLSLIWTSCLAMALLYVTFASKNPLVKNIPIGTRIKKHREWMIRCFSSVCSAITLRIYLFLFSALYMAGNPEASLNDAQKEVYAAATWLAITGNLILSEIYINMIVRKKEN